MPSVVRSAGSSSTGSSTVREGSRTRDKQSVRPARLQESGIVVQQPSGHFYLNLAKIPPNQVIADFGRGSSVESKSE